MPRVRRPEFPVFENFGVQLDHINTMMPRRFLRMLLPMLRCEKLAGGDDGGNSGLKANIVYCTKCLLSVSLDEEKFLFIIGNGLLTNFAITIT
jgi:hypothetical protein